MLCQIIMNRPWSTLHSGPEPPGPEPPGPEPPGPEPPGAEPAAGEPPAAAPEVIEVMSDADDDDRAVSVYQEDEESEYEEAEDFGMHLDHLFRRLGPDPVTCDITGKCHVMFTGWRSHYLHPPRADGPGHCLAMMGNTALRSIDKDHRSGVPGQRPKNPRTPLVCVDVRGSNRDQVAPADRFYTCTGFRREVQLQVAQQESLVQAMVQHVALWLHRFDPDTPSNYAHFLAHDTDPAARDIRSVQAGGPWIHRGWTRFGPSQPWALLFWCKSGHHRSVAAACLMAGCLERLGWPIVLHDAATEWGKTCAGGCRDCWRGRKRGPDPDALDLVWQALLPHLPHGLAIRATRWWT